MLAPRCRNVLLPPPPPVPTLLLLAPPRAPRRSSAWARRSSRVDGEKVEKNKPIALKRLHNASVTVCTKLFLASTVPVGGGARSEGSKTRRRSLGALKGQLLQTKRDGDHADMPHVPSLLTYAIALLATPALLLMLL